MTKKEIWVTFGIFLVVLVGVGAGLFVLSRGMGTTTGSTSREAQAQQDAMTLKQAQSDQSAANNDTLTVVAGANTANPGLLGSGQIASRQDATNANSPKPAPGPETFSQFEKYRDNPGALIGDIIIGGGDELKSGYQAAVLYKGWLTNGQMFDESRTGSDGKLQPFILTLGARQVMRGWDEGLVGMKVGGTRRIIIPPALGYGSTAQGSIPANSILVFDVQLLEIKAPQ
jgi:FKBP-type peptidyl-prolyl cis-trans isomerase FkpA